MTTAGSGGGDTGNNRRKFRPAPPSAPRRKLTANATSAVAANWQAEKTSNREVATLDPERWKSWDEVASTAFQHYWEDGTQDPAVWQPDVTVLPGVLANAATSNAKEDLIANPAEPNHVETAVPSISHLLMENSSSSMGELANWSTDGAPVSGVEDVLGGMGLTEEEAAAAAAKMQAVRIVLCPIVALGKQPLNLLGDLV
jgi:hypothetical protein